jgi:hypothetical protein
LPLSLSLFEAETMLHKECGKDEPDREVIEFLVTSGAETNAVDKVSSWLAHLSLTAQCYDD